MPIHRRLRRPVAGSVRRPGLDGADGLGVHRLRLLAPARGIPPAARSGRGRSLKATVRGRGHSQGVRRRSAERHLRHRDRPAVRRHPLHVARRGAHAAGVAAAGGHPHRGPARLSRGRHSAVRGRNRHRVPPADRPRKCGRDRHRWSGMLRAAVRPCRHRGGPGCHGRDLRAAPGVCAGGHHRPRRRRQPRRVADHPRAVRPQRRLRGQAVRRGLRSPHAGAVQSARFVRHAARAAVWIHAWGAARGSYRGHPSRRRCAEGAFAWHPRGVAAGAFRAAAGPAGARHRDLVRRRASRQGRPKDLWRLTCAVREGARR